MLTVRSPGPVAWKPRGDWGRGQVKRPQIGICPWGIPEEIPMEALRIVGTGDPPKESPIPGENSSLRAAWAAPQTRAACRIIPRFNNSPRALLDADTCAP